MPTQLFKSIIPIDILFALFDKICIKKNKYYVFDAIAFRKLVYYKYYDDFKNRIKPYYNLSKQHYVERKLDYKSFTNIIRQICKSNNVMFTSKIRYFESQYNIDYYIYFEEPTIPDVRLQTPHPSAGNLWFPNAPRTPHPSAGTYGSPHAPPFNNIDYDNIDNNDIKDSLDEDIDCILFESWENPL